MAALDSNNSGISYSMQEPSLRAMAPPSLFRAGSIQSQFSRNAEQQRDTAERNAGDTGSEMVKREKPFPELKPENANEVKAAFFNQAWIQEQRRATLARFQDQSHAMPRQERQRERVMER